MTELIVKLLAIVFVIWPWGIVMADFAWIILFGHALSALPWNEALLPLLMCMVWSVCSFVFVMILAWAASV